MFIAEREGFEPPEPCGSTVFKTAAIDHSAISPEKQAFIRPQRYKAFSESATKFPRSDPEYLDRRSKTKDWC